MCRNASAYRNTAAHPGAGVPISGTSNHETASADRVGRVVWHGGGAASGHAPNGSGWHTGGAGDRHGSGAHSHAFSRSSGAGRAGEGGQIATGGTAVAGGSLSAATVARDRNLWRHLGAGVSRAG